LRLRHLRAVDAARRARDRLGKAQGDGGRRAAGVASAPALSLAPAALPSFLASRTHAAPDGVGKPVRRKEDARLLTGAGRFGDDVSLPGQAYAAFVRSPYAHARVGAIETAAALAVPGVLSVLTGADAAADGLQPIPHRPVPTNPHEVPLRSRDGSAFFVAPHAAPPTGRAPGVGEPVAMVVAETAGAARDG